MSKNLIRVSEMLFYFALIVEPLIYILYCYAK